MDIGCWWPNHSLRRQVAVQLRRSQLRPQQSPTLDWQDVWAALARPLSAVSLGILILAIWLAAVSVAPAEITLGAVQTTLWQVQGTILGFAVAVAVFGLQIGRETFRGRAVALAPRLQASVYLGLVLVAVTGATALMPVVAQRATWGTLPLLVATLGWLAIVGAGIAEARRLTSSREQVHERIRHLRRSSERDARRLLEARVSASILKPELAKRGVELIPWSARADPGSKTDIAYLHEGVVSDIRTCRCYAALSKLPPGGSPEMSATLWRHVSTRTRLAKVPADTPAGVSLRVQRAVRISPGRGSGDLGDELNDLADAAAGSPDEALTNSVLDAYAQTLEAYALAWSPYVEAVTTDHLPATLGGERQAPIDLITTNVRKLIVSALRQEASGQAASAMFFPVRVMRDAIAWRAPGYFRMLSLEAAIVYITAEIDLPSSIRSATRERAWRYLTEGLAFFINGSGVAEPANTEIHAQAERAVRAALLEVLRAFVRVGDLEAFREGLRIWRVRERDSEKRDVQ